jgi:toxin YoeB
MKLVWDESAWEDYLWWQTQDRRVLRRINTLIMDVDRNGNEGIGKPEPLKHGFHGYWSRRITDEHRLVYKISEHADTTTEVETVRGESISGQQRVRVRSPGPGAHPIRSDSIMRTAPARQARRVESSTGSACAPREADTRSTGPLCWMTTALPLQWHVLLAERHRLGMR